MTTLPDLEPAGMAAFTEYFVKNYPGPETVIHKPEWHAPKLYRAAVDAYRRAARSAPEAGKAVDREEIARILFRQRQVPFSWDDDQGAPESDAGTLRSICLDDADAVLAALASVAPSGAEPDQGLWRFWNAKAQELAVKVDATRAEATSLRRKLEEHRKALEPFHHIDRALSYSHLQGHISDEETIPVPAKAIRTASDVFKAGAFE